MVCAYGRAMLPVWKPHGGGMIKYSVEDIENNGVEAVGVFGGVRREGWIMDGVDFVDYAGFAQLTMPVAEASSLEIGKWSKAEEGTPTEAEDLTQAELANMCRRRGHYRTYLSLSRLK